MPTPQPDTAALNKIAHEMALDDAISTLDCHLPAVRDKRGRVLWYDSAGTDQFSEWFVRRAIQYLELRGMLRRHAKRTSFVNWRRA